MTKVTKKKVQKTKNFRIGRKVFIGVFVAIFGILSFFLLTNEDIKYMLKGSIVPVNSTTTLYTNSKFNYVNLSQPVKVVKWKNSNPNVATVDTNGKVTVIGRGKTVITGITSDNRTYKYTIIGKTRVIMFIQASQGNRMQAGYKVHENNGFTYKVKDKTLIYHDRPGSGICWLTSLNPVGNYSEDKDKSFPCSDTDRKETSYSKALEGGTVSAVRKLGELYGNQAAYIELYLFYGLSGNSLTSQSCYIKGTDKPSIITDARNLKVTGESDIKTKYTAAMKLYSRAAQYFRDHGYTNLKAHVVSIYPADVPESHKKTKGGEPCKDANGNTINCHANWVFSYKKTACASGYNSNYKRYYANKVAQYNINNNKDLNLNYVEMFEKYVQREDNTSTKMKWVAKHSSYETTDGQHMTYGKDGGDNTAARYTRALFIEAGL